MMQFFQRLLGKTSAPAPIRGPLGLHLNAGFTLDTLAFRLLESSLLVALPGEKYTVAAASRIDLGGGSQIFRYYTSGDEFLQINTTGGTDVDDIDDIKLFVYEESFGINEERHWRSAIAPAAIGPMTLNWQKRRCQSQFGDCYFDSTDRSWVPVLSGFLLSRAIRQNCDEQYIYSSGGSSYVSRPVWRTTSGDYAWRSGTGKSDTVTSPGYITRKASTVSRGGYGRSSSARGHWGG